MPTPAETAAAAWEAELVNLTNGLRDTYLAVAALRYQHLVAQALAGEEGITVGTQDPILAQHSVIGPCDEAAWTAAAVANGSTQPWDTFRFQHVIRIPSPPVS